MGADLPGAARRTKRVSRAIAARPTERVRRADTRVGGLAGLEGRMKNIGNTRLGDARERPYRPEEGGGDDGPLRLPSPWNR